MAVVRKQGRSKKSASQRHAVSRVTQADAGGGSDADGFAAWMDERRVGADDKNQAHAQRERSGAVNSRPKYERRCRTKESRRGQR